MPSDDALNDSLILGESVSDARSETQLLVAETTADQRWELWIRRELQAQRDGIGHRDRDLTHGERITFACLILSGVVTVALAIGAVVEVLSMSISVAIATGATGLLPGGGTVIFFRVAKMLREERQYLRDLDDKRQSIGVKLAITQMNSDPQARARELANLADRLDELGIRAKQSRRRASKRS